MFGSWTYLIFELAWSIPVVAVQWLVGWRMLLSRALLLAALIGTATVYLSTADAIAIAQGIWTLHRNRIVGLYVGKVPMEECIFFFVTNVMVVQSVALVYVAPPRILLDRLAAWLG